MFYLVTYPIDIYYTHNDRCLSSVTASGALAIGVNDRKQMWSSLMTENLFLIPFVREFYVTQYILALMYAIFSWFSKFTR